MLVKELKEEVAKTIEEYYEAINALSLLQSQGVISSSKIWRQRTYIRGNVRDFIVKYVKNVRKN